MDDKTLYKIIGQNIKKYRKANNMTQQEFCERMKISLSYLTKIEAMHCDKSLSISLLNHIANELHLDIVDFFKEI